MKVLFFVPSHVDAVDIHHELTTRLAHCLQDSVEVRVATSSEKNISDILGDYDVMHVFGCWSNSACKLADKAYRNRIPYVITPLGMLQPWEMEKHGSTIMLKRQRRITARASAVNVCGKLENETFQKLGWNGRMTLIKNPVLTSQTTFGTVALQLVSLYRKVLDSNARVILKNDAREAIGQLLQLGLDKQGFEYSRDISSLCDKLSKLTADDWRCIFIYAADEQVDEPIKYALDLLRYQYPQTDVTSVDRYDTKKLYDEGALKDDVLLSRNLLLRNKVKETFSDRGKTEQQVCLKMLNLHYELNRRAAPLRHLGDMYTTLRFTKMDEDLVRDMCKELDMTEFGERLMAVMADLLGLTEGFMVFRPRRGKTTKTIERALTKFGVYKTT